MSLIRIPSSLSNQHTQPQQLCIGIGEWRVTGDSSAQLVTYSLGSCIGVSVYDTEKKLGGLGHFMMPSHRSQPKSSNYAAAAYVDSGFTAMLQELFNMGATRPNLEIKIAGAARVIACDDRFRIGEKNLAVARKVLWKNSLMLTAEDTGGSLPRNMKLDLENGQIEIKMAGTLRKL